MSPDEAFWYDVSVIRSADQYWQVAMEDDAQMSGDDLGIGRIYAMLMRLLLRG